MSSALSIAARERRAAESKIISAKADVESAKLLREAADALNSKAAMQIRYLETLDTLCCSNNVRLLMMPKKKISEAVKKR